MAFKRAAAAFGLGRYLYDMPSQWVEFDNQRKRISDTGLKQLEDQYRSWYARTVTQAATQEDTQSAGSVDNPFEDQAEQAQATLPYEMLSQLHQLGKALYGNAQWEVKRPHLCHAASSGATSSSKHLTPDQAQLLIDGLAKRLQGKQGQHMKIAA